jgi:amidase
LLKDLITTYAGAPSSRGCKALKNYIAPSDSALMKKYRAAGLVVLGKTNTPEFGLKGVTEPEAFGATLNPWDLERSPAGSSGGSAAAIASGMVPFASGGDGGGSIRMPASWCGLFGLKPSRGRLPTAPFGEMWHGAVVEHVLTRSVRDSAAMLDATMGNASGMPYFSKKPERPYLEEVGRPPGKLHIAFTTKSFIGSPVDAECVEAVEKTAKLLESLGHHVEEAMPGFDGKEMARSFIVSYLTQAAEEVDELGETLGRPATRRDVEPLTWVSYLLGKAHSALELNRALRVWNKLARIMGNFHEHYDLLLTPTSAVPPIKIGALDPTSSEKMLINLVNTFGTGKLLKSSGIVEELADKNLAPVPFTQLANMTGQPAMSVPIHWTKNGLPCGVQFIAANGEEGILFQVAGQLEQAAPWFDKVPPIFAE